MKNYRIEIVREEDMTTNQVTFIFQLFDNYTVIYYAYSISSKITMLSNRDDKPDDNSCGIFISDNISIWYTTNEVYNIIWDDNKVEITVTCRQTNKLLEKHTFY